MNSVQFHADHTKKSINRILFLLVIIICISGYSFGNDNPKSFINETSLAIRVSHSDSLKIEKLSEQAFYYTDKLGDKAKADSVSQIAVNIAEESYRPHLLLFAYTKYIENNDASYNLKKSLQFGLEAEKLSKQISNLTIEWHIHASLVKIYLAGYKFENAINSSFRALSLADALQNEFLKGESYLLIGQSLESNNQKIEAFRNYLNAASLAEKTKDTELLKKCYSRLSAFYNNSKLYDKAILYKLRQVDIIIKTVPVDSTELMWAKYDLQVININSNNNKLNIKNMREVLDFAIKSGNERLKNYEIALYRSHLIEAENVKQLYSFYKIDYPGEFKKLEIQNPAMYYRMKAYFCEEENKADSALLYLLKADALIQADPNKILLSKFYQRFGNFLIRQGKHKEAIDKFRESYELAYDASYFEYMLSASQKLESLYAELGDYKNAYFYGAWNKSLTDSINVLTQNNQLLTLEIEHETRLREIAAEQEIINTHHRHNVQYTAITIIIITLFIILMMLGSLKVPAWIIKMLGFFSFILFFEFLIMISDHKIYEVTANEPWKILAIKIALIAFLLPFHHWIEKKVIHYLIEHKLIKIPRFSLKYLLKRQEKNITRPVEDEV